MLVTLAALAEPHRFQIVELLRDKPRAVGEIVKKLKLNQPQVSKHLKVLSLAGLVEAQTFAQLRVYQLRLQPLKELDHWLNSYKKLWEQRLDQLDEYLHKIQSKEKINKNRKDLSHESRKFRAGV
jgi:DNA-binding transcriptional ArsR family regulator